MKTQLNVLVGFLVLVFFTCIVAAQTTEEVTRLVKQTKKAIESNATETLLRVNRSEHPYKDQDNPSLYVFILDIDLNVVAHAIKPGSVGKNLKGKPDVKGKMFRDEMRSKALKDGFGWVDYYYLNPKTGEMAHKNSYFELANGSDGKKYIVGSGKYYEK